MMENRKINIKNIILGVILMCGCAYIGATSAIPHQTELVTNIINIPMQFTEQKDTVSQESVVVALQSNVGVLNAIPDISSLVKIIIFVGIALLVFSFISMTGLVPRFGGMGD